MKNNKVFLAIQIFTFCLFVSSCAHAQAGWVGEYEFFEDCGKTAGGSSISVSTKIKITEDYGKLKGLVSADGYMTWYQIFAEAKVTGDHLELYFLKKGDGNLDIDFKKGVLLLAIQKDTAKGKSKFVISWKELRPALSESEESCGVSFEKIVPNKKS